jgi:hypothetical protein
MTLRTAPEPRRKKPVCQRRERDFIRRTPLSPTVRFSRWMDGGRHDDHTAIASKIEPGGKAGFEKRFAKFQNQIAWHLSSAALRASSAFGRAQSKYQTCFPGLRIWLCQEAF